MTTKISIIIPYFQRKQGILRRALLSVLAQQLPPDTLINAIVVDDGAPVPASGEAEGLSFASPFSLQIIPQPNGGVASARNTGLQSLDNTTDYVAFLDSDDIWSPAHLATAIGAMNAGYDFYFCDNRRQGFHDSYFAACCPGISATAQKFSGQTYIGLSKDEVLGAILKAFPTQASTTMFKRNIAPNLRFDNSLHSAGEDVLFFSRLAAASTKPGFHNNVMVECADGVNLYFGNFGWDSPKRLPIAYDQIRAHKMVLNAVPLNTENKNWLKKLIASYEDEFVFFSLRYIVKNKKCPPELAQACVANWWFAAWFAASAVKIAIKKVLGQFHPK